MIAQSPIAILGAGSWGTAMAIHLAKYHSKVFLWGRDPNQLNSFNIHRQNTHYLPGYFFPDTLELVYDLSFCQKEARYLLIAVPSHVFAELICQLDRPSHGIAWLTKGLNASKHPLFSDLVTEHWGDDYPRAMISGPSFATEVVRELPTALTIAGNSLSYQRALQQLIHHGNLRVYLSHDLIGVQLSGAVKNVIAIACGISDGLGYGSNARAALITRGLRELQRLGQVLGAKNETFQGLAGIGDMLLTCTDHQSRNWRFGMLVGQGVEPLDAEQIIGQVVEGKKNAKQIVQLARQHGVDTPICEQVHSILERQITPQQAVVGLMSRAVDFE